MVAGDVRANENIALTATHTLFAREHNRIVDALPADLPEELKFQIARRIVSAEQQYITYRSSSRARRPAGALPRLRPGGRRHARQRVRDRRLPRAQHDPRRDRAPRRPDVHARRSWPRSRPRASRSSARATRPSSRSRSTSRSATPTCSSSVGVGPVLAALGNESEYRNDELIDDQLRSVLFQVPRPGRAQRVPRRPPLPTCFTGVVDLGAIDVERGRDHGMPSYNALRRAFGLAPQHVVHRDHRRGAPTRSRPADRRSRTCLDFTGAARHPRRRASTLDSDDWRGASARAPHDARRAPARVYGNVDKIDAFTGMLAEPHVLGIDFGELQLAIWKQQFEALRDGDRFYYLNDPALALIERDYGISARRTLAQVIDDNTDEDVRDDVFRLDGAPAFDHRDGGVGAHRRRHALALARRRGDLRRVCPGRRARLHREQHRDRDLDRRRRGAERAPRRG